MSPIERRPRLVAALLWSAVATAGAGIVVVLLLQDVDSAAMWAGIGSLFVALVTLLAQFRVFRGSRRTGEAITPTQAPTQAPTSATYIWGNGAVVNGNGNVVPIDLGDRGTGGRRARQR